MRSGALWLFLPDEILPLVFALGLVLFLFGARRVGGGLMLTPVLVAALGPIVEELMARATPGVALAMAAVAGLWILRAFASLLLGSRAADEMVGELAADAVRFSIRLVAKGAFFPCRVAFRALFPGRAR